MSVDFFPPAGKLNKAVIQDTIGTTICVPGWTEKIRPPSSYTTRLKNRQMVELGLPGRPEDYEEDHFIPLALGGHPNDPANLWPMPMRLAKGKDRWETELHRQVCSGKMSLAEAQLKIVQPGLWETPVKVSTWQRIKRLFGLS